MTTDGYYAFLLLVNQKASLGNHYIHDNSKTETMFSKDEGGTNDV